MLGVSYTTPEAVSTSLPVWVVLHPPRKDTGSKVEADLWSLILEVKGLINHSISLSTLSSLHFPHFFQKRKNHRIVLPALTQWRERSFRAYTPHYKYFFSTFHLLLKKMRKLCCLSEVWLMPFRWSGGHHPVLYSNYVKFKHECDFVNFVSTVFENRVLNATYQATVRI